MHNEYQTKEPKSRYYLSFEIILFGWVCYPVAEKYMLLILPISTPTRLLRLVEDDITALELEGFKVDEQTLYCNVLSIDNGSLSGSGDTAPSLPPSNLLLQATNSGLRLVGIQGLTGRGCLSTWRSPSGKSVSCMSSHGSLVLVASGSDLYALRITGTPEAPQFTQLRYVRPWRCYSLSFSRSK